MKKNIIIFMLCIISTMCFGQLHVQSKEEYAGYKTVIDGFGGWTIRFIQSDDENHGYYLMGSTDNQFEKSMASVFLGHDKESALLTINDLINIKQIIEENGGEVVVKGFSNKATTIFLYTFNQPYIKTEGVAGYSACVSWILQKSSREKMITAIQNFIE